MCSGWKLVSNSFKSNFTFRVFIYSIELWKTCSYILIAFVEKVDGFVLGGGNAWSETTTPFINWARWLDILDTSLGIKYTSSNHHNRALWNNTHAYKTMIIKDTYIFFITIRIKKVEPTIFSSMLVFTPGLTSAKLKHKWRIFNLCRCHAKLFWWIYKQIMKNARNTWNFSGPCISVKQCGVCRLPNPAM